jgi:hypothetical protein
MSDLSKIAQLSAGRVSALDERPQELARVAENLPDDVQS